MSHWPLWDSLYGTCAIHVPLRPMGRVPLGTSVKIGCWIMRIDPTSEEIACIRPILALRARIGRMHAISYEDRSILMIQNPIFLHLSLRLPTKYIYEALLPSHAIQH